MGRRCLTCSEANLFKEGCLDSLHPEDSETMLLYHNRSSASFEALRKLPRNKYKMKSKTKKYMYKHSKSDCQHGRMCVFPHSKLEEEVWNFLLYSTEKSPEPEPPDQTALVSRTEVSVIPILQCLLINWFSDMCMMAMQRYGFTAMAMEAVIRMPNC